MPSWVIRETGIAGKRNEAVEILTEALCEMVGPGKSDQGNFRVRIGSTQGADGGNHVQHIAELKGPENGDLSGHKKNVLKRTAPYKVQKMDVKGMQTEVQIISAIWAGARDVPRRRFRANPIVSIAHPPAAAAETKGHRAAAATRASSSRKTIA
jgi:hypothetical protein